MTENQSQAEKFTELAQELECDEDEARFEETVKRVARSKPPLPEPKS